MNSALLHDYVLQIEAPLRERAVHEAAQRELALQRHQPPIGFAVRLALGQALVGLGRSIQGRPARALGNRPEAAA